MASRSLWSLLFVMLVLFASEEMMVQVNGTYCGGRSKTFKGLCLSNENCANVCRTEGFTGGLCTKIFRHCHCEAPCDGGPAAPMPLTPF
ncbi:defensin Tk-AMP-D1.1-like [Macadamia integrifolia]|uniref:defensin Tk-AMP-D1.1-like n=1 Tax=Macadamia integrifolia TaxID=60698 RepID=UPI001C4FD8C8|nr:defensin Tk-AMP-D1.1-like [Macadamia integrifolia]